MYFGDTDLFMAYSSDLLHWEVLENEESKVIALRNAIQDGIDSGIAQDFDPKKHLESLKAKKHSNG